jgi:glycerol-3-phosphate dehydrogenase
LRRSLIALDRDRFDVLIIGGGITGACLAHDTALRGLSVALIDRGDFGGATSAASSRLLHGGIRYLQQFRLDKVRESARERTQLRRIAPHLVRWVPFLVPTDRSLARGRRLLAGGMALYALLGGADESGDDLQVPTGTYFDHNALRREAPALAVQSRFTGAFVLNECHVHSSERMTLAFLKTAVAHGAVVANHVACDGLLREGERVVGVRARERERADEIRIRARLTVNAAGPWLPGLNEAFGVGSLRRPVNGFAQGAHIVTRQVLPRYAAALPTERASGALLDRGGRHVFVIPWRGHSLIGTSNRPFRGEPGAVRPEAQDVTDLVDDVNRALPAARLRRDEVHHAFAGLYPLTARRIDADAYQGTGDYQIVDHEAHGLAHGIVSVLGAKYTTARLVAELATDSICRRLGRSGIACRTRETPLVGAPSNAAALRRRLEASYGGELQASVLQSLVRQYGEEAEDVLRGAVADPALLRRVADERETIGAEVAYAVDHEMAVRLVDVVFRRTGLGLLGHPGERGLERCAAIMAARLGWSAVRRAEELRDTVACFPIPRG